MAIPFLNVSCQQRSKGANAISKAAYNSCSCMSVDGDQVDYTRKAGLVFSELMLQAQKKRNSMLIQLGLLFINNINWMEDEEGRDIKLEAMDYYIELVEERINEEEANFNEKFGEDRSTKEAKSARKSVYDKYIMKNALKNMRENYLKTGKAKI